jgi:hypothetical protein
LLLIREPVAVVQFVQVHVRENNLVKRTFVAFGLGSTPSPSVTCVSSFNIFSLCAEKAELAKGGKRAEKDRSQQQHFHFLKQSSDIAWHWRSTSQNVNNIDSCG